MSQLICFQCPYLSDLALSPADSAQKCFFLVPKHDWSHPSLVWDCTHIYRNETRWIRRCWLYEDEGGFSHECWKKKKKTPQRWKEAHPDNRTKLQLVWARLCLVGNLSSTPRPALPRPLPPSRCEIQTSPGWLCVAAKVSLCSAVWTHL